MPSLYKRLFVRKHAVLYALFAVMMLLNIKASAQWGIDGQLQVELGKKYTYTPTYNGTSNYPYCGEYHYVIIGGFTQDRTYYGYYDGFNDCLGGGSSLKDAALSITWFDKAGQVQLYDANWNLLTSINVSKGGYDLSGPISIIPGNSYKYTLTCNGPGNPAVCGGAIYISGGYFTSTGDTYIEGGIPCSPNTSMDFDITWTSDYGYITLYGTTWDFITEINPNNYAAPLIGGTLTPDMVYMYAGDETPLIMGSLPAGGGGPGGPGCYEYFWEVSYDNVNWSWLDGGTFFQHWQPGTFYQEAYLRRGVYDCNGNIAYSNTVYFGVEPKTCFLFGSSQNINAGTAPKKLRLALFYGPSVPEYRWQSSTDNINWTDIPLDRYSSEYQPGPLTTTTFYRVICTNAVPQVTSNTVVVKICSVSGSLQINGSSTCIKGSATQLTTNIPGGQWGSSNQSVAKVDDKGLITGIAEGTTNINYFVTNPCGSHTAKFVITVIAPPPMAKLGKGIEYAPKTSVIPLVENTVVSNEYDYTGDQSSAHTIKNVLALQVNEEYSKMIPGDFTASVILNLEYGHTEADKCSQKKEVTLKVNYTKNGGAKYDALNYFVFEGAEFTQVTVKKVEAPLLTVNGVAFDTKAVLGLTNKMLVTRYYDLANNQKPYDLTPTVTVADAVHLTWKISANTNNNAVQLEWAWLEDGMEDNYKNSNGIVDPALVLNAGATRIDLKSNEYDIPLMYEGRGTVYMRVRAVSILPSGSRSDGPWSSPASYVFDGHEPNLNWQATTSFAEEGKRKTVVQYYDGTLRSRQTVTKDNTTGQTVVAETMYDMEGRPAVQVLPVPGINNVVAYTRNLNRFNGQLVDLKPEDLNYEQSNPAAFFDLSPVPSAVTGDFYTTTAMDYSPNKGTGAAKYYSEQNPDHNTGIHQNIPEANGYPYTVTRYTPDGTGRIMRQSGVGDSHKMGSGHETKYFYGTPEKEVLDPLFGTEIGNYSHYFKNMVQDANGQVSVSYIDMNGRTIATALAGNSDMESLSSSGSEQNINRDLLSKESNLLKGNKIESISTILVPVNDTKYTFRYELKKQTITLPACNGGTVSYDCKFDLEIAITDETGENPPDVHTETGIGITDYVFDKEVMLPIGSYSVRKTLSINQAWLEDLVAKYSADGVGICNTLQELITTITIDDEKDSRCNLPVTELTSSDCISSLGTFETYKNKYAASISPATITPELLTDIKAQYDAELAFCMSLDPARSHTLKTIRQQMLGDMVPFSGQYADPGRSGFIYNKYNIFSEAGGSLQPFYKNPRYLTKAGDDKYYNDYGAVDPTVNAVMLHDVSMNKDKFYQMFKESWANSLLPHHPEYKKLEWAENNLGSSFDFIDKLQANTIAYDPIPDDDFFKRAEQATNKSIIESFSKTSWPAANGYSMWQLAYGDAFGCKTLTSQDQRNTCYDRMPRTFKSTGTVVNNGLADVLLTDKVQSQAWLEFKGFYTQVRSNFVNTYINEEVGSNDNELLTYEGYRLYFPKNFEEAVRNNAAVSNTNEWAAMIRDAQGNFPSITYGVAHTDYGHPCDSYINAWRQALLACPQLDSRGDKEEILTSIITKMQEVCRKGTDGGNPYGASSVAPAYLGDQYKSFEDVILGVFRDKGIPLSEVCHPYDIYWPRPYGMNPRIAQQSTTSVESCNCSQWSKLLQEMAQAEVSTSSLESINNYLKEYYKETISAELYAGLLKCNQSFQVCKPVTNPDPDPCPECRTTAAAPNPNCTYLTSIPLTSAQPLPAFLMCGFDKSIARCFTCSAFVKLKDEFKNVFKDLQKEPDFSGEMTDEKVKWNNLFANYVNYKTGLQHNWLYYASQFKTSGCPIGNITGDASVSTLSICRDDKPLNDATVNNPPSPCESVRAGAKLKASIVYEYLKQHAMASLKTAYQEKCSTVNESFYVNYTLKEYHYTLYYYDRAGNLVKTVPPKGVQPNYDPVFLAKVKVERENREKGLSYTEMQVDHSLTTRYFYNSLNKVVLQQTPDAGISQFWYDELGRLAATQNAEQVKAGNVYTYTRYDEYGRVKQVSQLTGVNKLTDATSRNEGLLSKWYSDAYNSQTQIVQTVYDIEYGVIDGYQFKQNNLRDRIAYTSVWNKVGDPYPMYSTYYSYDVHGNVDELLQDFGRAEVSNNIMNNNRLKRIVYDYDLISGKVNKVSYQPGEPDAYYHRYEYDGENRLTDVYSGRDEIMLNVFKEREAHYDYYKHGPLAAATLGQLMVQKQDYAYTLQGWLKGVNPAFGGTLANGTNMTDANPKVAQDAYGFSLHYFINDYKAIGFSRTNTVLGSLGSDAFSLYNGNIAAMAVNIPKLGASKVYNYHYDQLNRLVAMDAYNGLDISTGSFNKTLLNEYKERVSYDPNGNIISYLRNGDAARLSMDKLTYHYTPESNKLHKVTDEAIDASDADYSKYYDLRKNIQGQSDPAQNDGNYKYDAIGNLIQDISEGITNIKWTVYGKIASITKSGVETKYVYDAAGNRVLKINPSGSTAYVRDGSGNVLSVYTGTTADNCAQSELHLYGSSRLGMVTKRRSADGVVPLDCGFGIATNRTFTRGEKLFELNNHLGNVLATVTDKKIAIAQVVDETKIDHYEADKASAQDYYPFGMIQPGRKWNAGGYRYGFNGKENDNDVKGEGNQVAFEARIFDARVGRFLSTDPLEHNYPYQSTYVFAHNCPIACIDYLGMGDPPVPMVLDERHLISGSNFTPKEVNSMIVNPEWQNRATLQTFYEEAVTLVKQRGNIEIDVVLSNGSKWNVNVRTGHFYPVSSVDGSIVNLSKAEMWVLQSAIKSGEGEAIFANIGKNRSISRFSNNMVAALEAFAKARNVAPADALKHIAGKLPVQTNGVSMDALKKLASKIGPKTANYIRWGGKALIAVGVANDIYEIYNSTNKPRTITTKVVGWHSAGVGASTGAALLSETGPGAVLGGIVGGIIGYYMGTKTTEVVYDWIFTKQ
jgi:RHS repeat-associated protein